MERIVLLLLIWGWAGMATAETLPARVVSVIDGGTIVVELGAPGALPEVFRVISVRLVGIDTPEIHHRCKSATEQTQLRAKAAEAKHYLATLLPAGSAVTLEDVARGKFFRLVARVMHLGMDVNQQLMAAGLAKPMADTRRPSWCD